MTIFLGKSKVSTYEELGLIQIPEETKTYKPVSHQQVVDIIREQIDELRFDIVGETFGLSKPRKGKENENNYLGAKMFGQIKIADPSGISGMHYAIAFRNSYNQSVALGIAAGNSVIVCDNMLLSGRWLKKRKHTSGINAHEVIANGFSGIQEEWNAFQKKLDYLKCEGMDDGQAAKAILDSVASGVIPETLGADVWREWNTPAHDEFKRERNIWRLYMGYTEVFKESNSYEMQGDRTSQLTQWLFNYTGANDIQEGSSLFVAEAVNTATRQLQFDLGDAQTEAQIITAGAAVLAV